MSKTASRRHARQTIAQYDALAAAAAEGGSGRRKTLSQLTPEDAAPMAAALVEVTTRLTKSAGTIDEAYEPYLLQQGFLMRTPRGRVVTPRGRKHLGLKVLEGTDESQETLW